MFFKHTIIITLSFIKTYFTIIVSCLAVVVSILSFYATYKNAQLIEEQNRKIYFDNLLEKISKLREIEENSNHNLKSYKDLTIFILKGYMQNNDFNHHKKDLELLIQYHRHLISALVKIRITYEYLLSFSNQWTSLNDKNLKFLKVQYIMFRQQSENLIESLKKTTYELTDILTNKKAINDPYMLSIASQRIPSQRYLYMLFMQNVNIAELENIKEEENRRLIDSDLKDFRFTVDISDDSLYLLFE